MYSSACQDFILKSSHLNFFIMHIMPISSKEAVCLLVKLELSCMESTFARNMVPLYCMGITSPRKTDGKPIPGMYVAKQTDNYIVAAIGFYFCINRRIKSNYMFPTCQHL